jgi:Ca2+-binding RTX toxin-like protein
MTQTLPRADGVGSDFLVNTTVSGRQQNPAVAALPSGNFVVVWSESDGGNPSSFDQDVRAQIVGRDGHKIGPEILVNTVAAGSQQSAVVSGLSGGGFVVTWMSAGFPLSVHAQAFDSAGNKVGGEINESDGFNTQGWPEVAGLTDGGFALTWRERTASAQDPNGDFPVKVQLFNADGSARGAAATVNSGNTGLGGSLSFNDEASIAGLPNGGFVIAWTDKSGAFAGDTSGKAILAQRFDATGAKTGGPLLVNTTAGGDQVNAHVVALSGGGFAITWNDDQQFVGRAQIFDSSGNKAGTEITSYYNLTAASTPDNQVLLAWNTFGNTSLRAYDASGNAVGFESAPFPAEVVGHLAVNGDDQILMTWNKTFAEDANRSDVYAQLAVLGQHGTSGADAIVGTAHADVVYGEAGNDNIVGGAGNDTLSGGDGDDNLRGGAGVDSFDGGADDGMENLDTGFADKVSFYDAAATQNVTADLRTGVISNDGFGNVETMTGIESLGAGTQFIDTFNGNDSRNFLWGSKFDNLFGFGGDDILYADSAPSTIDGGTGIDELRLSSDGGWLTWDSNGDGLADVVGAMTYGWEVDLQATVFWDGYPGSSGGRIYAVENVTGSALDDWLYGDGLANVLKGEGDDDWLYGRGGNDRLEGGDGNDLLSGGAGDDQVFGGAGGDAMYDGAGIDSFDGGDNPEGFNNVSGYADAIVFGDRANTQGAVADLRTGIISNDGFGNAETMTGVESLTAYGPYADVLYGNDAVNFLVGATGDSLFGFGGDDILYLDAAGSVDGGTGQDRLDLYADGGFYIPDKTGDGLAEVAAAMTSGWTVNLAAGTLVDGYGNAGTVTGVEEVNGSRFADTLIGGSGDDRLDGREGNDVLNLGLGGNDSVSGGEGNDYFFFADTLTAADTVDGGAGSDTLALLGTYNLTLGANTLSGIETLSLLSGTAAGGLSHVTYSITTVDSNVALGAQLTVYAGGLLSDETLLFDGHAETDSKLSVFGGAGNDLIAGGPAADAFVGGAGDDQLYGLGGNDWLEGGLGADLLRGGFGSDLFVYKSAAESTAAASDHIVDFEDQVDLINLQAVDANASLAGDQAFSFIGQNAFSHTAGELRIEGSGSSWFVQGDTNGDGIADLVIQVDTFRGYALQATNFVL